ncbi:50S ribosomal protein L18 [Candidatus Woesearchaeota archaeon]|nr:50S ribosomal protein L18 [Candidatus Woesearchaeota archaeon]MBL7050591.1 50S ribosomal protein L18 [Candidatus Woesearchaeota archaeon]
MSKTIKKVNYRRKREGRTNYNKRLKLLLSKKPRLVIRRSLNNITLQIVEYQQKGDKIITGANSSELKKIGWKANTGNIPSAYLTGVLLAKKAKEHKIGEVIVDLGLNNTTKGSRLFAALKGAIDNGLQTPHSEDMFPNEESIKGTNIANYLKNSNKSKTQFSEYLKNKIDILKQFEEIKKKIMK